MVLVTSSSRWELAAVGLSLPVVVCCVCPQPACTG